MIFALVVLLVCVIVLLFVWNSLRKEISGLIETWYLKCDKDLMEHINDTSVLYTEEELLW